MVSVRKSPDLTSAYYFRVTLCIGVNIERFACEPRVVRRVLLSRYELRLTLHVDVCGLNDLIS